MIIKNRLKEIRKESRISQKEFHSEILKKSLDIDVSLRTLQNWESNTFEMKPEIAFKIADFFNVSVSYLLGYSENSLESTEDKTERILLNSNKPNNQTVLYGKEEFQSVSLTGTIDQLRNELIEKFQEESQYNSNIKNPEKWAEEWLNTFFATFEIADPPVKVLLARYYSIPENKREPIDILLNALNDYMIKDAEKLRDSERGHLTIIEPSIEDK